MTAAIIASASGTFATGANNVSVGMPTTPLVGNLLIMFVHAPSATGGWNTPSGWTKLTAGTTANMYYRIADGSEQGQFYSVSWTTNSKGSYGTLHVSGAAVSLTPDANNLQANASSANITAPSVSPSWPNDLLINFYSTSVNAAITLPGGQSSYSGFVVSGNAMSLSLGYETLAAAGATGTRVATSSAAANVGASIALRDASAGFSGGAIETPGNVISIRGLLRQQNGLSVASPSFVLSCGHGSGTASLSGTCKVGSTPLPGVYVTISPTNAPNNVIGTTISAGDGTFSFSNIPAGWYVVEGVDPTGRYDGVIHTLILAY